MKIADFGWAAKALTQHIYCTSHAFALPLYTFELSADSRQSKMTHGTHSAAHFACSRQVLRLHGRKRLTESGTEPVVAVAV